MRRIILGLCAFAMAANARADWPAGGVLVCSSPPLNGIRNAVVFDLPSGDLGVISVENGGNSNYYQLQRIGRDGVIAPGWPAAGVSLYFVLKGTPLSWQGIAWDDSSYVWHAFQNSSGTHAQRVGPTGDAGGTDVLPFTVLPLTSSSTRVTLAPNGDAFILTGNRLKRITRAGIPAAGWTSTGITLPNQGYEDAGILPDGAGGVVVFLRGSPTSGAPVVARTDGSGAAHAGWPAGGLPLCSPPSIVGLTAFDSRLIASGPDHFIALWTFPTPEGPPLRELRLQRFGLDGTLDPSWPAEGLSPFPHESFAGFTAVPDGSGGVYILRPAPGGQLGTHVTVAGTILGNPETSLLQPGDQYLPVPITGATLPDAVIADRTPNGGLLVGWNDTRLSPEVSFRLRWWNPDLTPDPTKPDSGLIVLPTSPHNTFPGTMMAVHADGDDGAFVAWGDYHDNGSGTIVADDLWMKHVQIPATTAVAPRPGPSRLTLSAPRPNPARGSIALDVALPDDSPARVDLLDVAGRVLRTQHVQGAGAHMLSFAELGGLEPGLYFVRASSRAGARSSRFVLTR